MKHVESQFIREMPKQRRISVFRLLMLVLAVVLVIIVTRHKVFKIEFGVSDIETGSEEEKFQVVGLAHEVEGKPLNQRWSGLEAVGQTFRRYNLSYLHGNRVTGKFII